MKTQNLDLVLMDHLSGDEALVVSLHEVAKNTIDGGIRSTAYSLLRWFQSRGEWTHRQKELADSIVRGHRRSHFLRQIPKPHIRPVREKPKPKPSYALYAVRIGEQLKIGHSSNVKSRVSSYRTGSSDVELLETLDLGQCSPQHARTQERKLHKHLEQHRIERELFRIEALSAFRAFVPRRESCA